MLRGRGGKVGHFRSLPCSWWLYLRFCSVSAWPEVRNPSLPRHFCFKAIVRPRVRNYCWGIGQFNLCRNMLRDRSLTNCCCLPPCNQLPAAVSVLGCKTMKSGTHCSQDKSKRKDKTRQVLAPNLWQRQFEESQWRPGAQSRGEERHLQEQLEESQSLPQITNQSITRWRMEGIQWRNNNNSIWWDLQP